jgi:hypothetical protein
LKPDAKLRAEGALTKDVIYKFKSSYGEFKHAYLTGERSWDKLREDRIVARRDLRKNNCPVYLAEITCKAPSWAKESVMPYRGSDMYAKTLAKLNRIAATRPEVAEALAFVQELICQMGVASRPMSLPKTGFERRNEDEALADQDAMQLKYHLGIDGANAEQFLYLVNYLDTAGVPRVLAKAYCSSFFRREHHDALDFLRRAQKKNNVGPLGSKPLPLSVVNRVFCTDRSGWKRRANFMTCILYRKMVGE